MYWPWPLTMSSYHAYLYQNELNERNHIFCNLIVYAYLICSVFGTNQEAEQIIYIYLVPNFYHWIVRAKTGSNLI